MIVPGALVGVTDFVLVSAVPANPDSITAVLYRWVAGTRSASGVSVTVTAVGAGEYRFTWTNDGGWSITDDLELVALPVVSGVTYPATLWRSHGHVDAAMRGTNGANTVAPSNSTIASIYALLQLTDANVSTLATDTRDAILNRVLAGNHDTAGTVGLLLQFLDAIVSSRATPAQVLAQVTAALDAISATALARFATVDTGETTAAAGSVAKLAQGAGGSGGLTEDQQEQLDRIEAQAAKLSGTPVTVNGNVKPGGQIVLKHGDDYTVALGNPVSVAVDDVGGSLHTLMVAVGVVNLQVAAIRGSDTASRILGTISALSYANNVLSVTLEFTATETAKGVVGPSYVYDVIKTDTPTRTYFSGKLTLVRDAR